jgi:uncharacterized membrane protein YhaH (DUF805 family)
MVEWYKMAFTKYADFETRSTRNEFWWFFLMNLIIIFGVNIIAGILAGIIDAPVILMVASILIVIYALAIFIPNLAVSVRRLHDTNRSGWNILLGLIPFIGSIVLLVFYAQESHPSPNKWGPVPGAKGNLEDALVEFDDDMV